MQVKTHKEISAELCGAPLELAEGRCRLSMKTVPLMRADEANLVHGGFVFGMADYAAMLAVNHPFVVLGSAESSFLKPVSVGDELEALAEVKESSGRKRRVEVTVSREGVTVMSGLFTCFVLDKHVLEK
ncbi:MAG: PaaI family thioesterase [Deltaproteobacteria bacterium]|jgi:acyl-coenzyme A thioesterase PaaI-like protein|nr:PaaI family thioesterase [Deltaproteobacteria bacterium]